MSVQFYRAKKLYNPKANAVLKPIDIAADTILKAESTVFYGETLVHAVAAEITKLMDDENRNAKMNANDQKQQEMQTVSGLIYIISFIGR